MSNSNHRNNNGNQRSSDGNQSDRAAKRKLFSAEIVLESGGNLLWPPTKERLRGRFVFAEIAVNNELSEAMRTLSRDVPVIPGLYIEVDLDERTVAIRDPLSCTDEGKKLNEKLQAGFAGIPQVVGNATAPHPGSKSLAEPDTLKNWLHHLAKLVHKGKAVPTKFSQEFPTLKEVDQLDGLIDIQPFAQALPRDKRLAKEAVAGNA